MTKQTIASIITIALVSVAAHAQNTVIDPVSKSTNSNVFCGSVPDKPQVTGNSACYGNDNTAITAVGSSIQWYNSNMALVGTGNSYTPPLSVSSVGTYTYYATQTVNGTESDTAGVIYRINATPASPVVTGNVMCEGEGVPVLQTNLKNDNWYSDETAETLVGTGYFYTPTGVTDKSVTYYVVRTINGCNSDVVPVTLTVIKKPTFTIGKEYVHSCINEPVETIQAEDFSPAMNAKSSVSWKVGSTAIADNSGHTITPTICIEAKTYTITAVYNYYNTTYSALCASDPDTILYTINPKPSIALASDTVIVIQGEQLEPLVAYGSSGITWLSDSLSTGHGQEYNFALYGITELNLGTYLFELYDSSSTTGCKSDTLQLVYKVISATGVKTIYSDTDEIAVYPTEATEKVIVSSQSILQHAAITLVSSTGTTVYSTVASGSRFEIPVSGIANGVYTVKVQSGKILKTKSIIVK